MVEMYTSPDIVRRKLGFTTEVEDDVLNHYIEGAQREMLTDIAMHIEDDVLSGNINGSNTTFSTGKTFIADQNFNLRVDADDIKIYGWGNLDDPSTKTSLSVSTIYPEYSKVVLSSAPVSTYKQITADYYYYPCKVYFDQFSDACAYLAAYNYALAEYALLPKSWMHGAYRFIFGREYRYLYNQYINKISKILGRISERGEHDAAVLLRG